jgi:L-malate glycosyltransferase
MKVLLVGAGNSIHLQRWANGLVQAGCSVACATLHAPLPQGWDARVALHRLQPAGGAGYVLAVPALRRLVRLGGFDLVHAHYATGYGCLATLAACRPRLVSVWGSDVDEFPDRSPLHAAFLRRILLQADALAATSQALVHRVQQQTDQATPVFVTPFGVDTRVFVPPVAQVQDPLLLVIGSSKSLAPTYGIDTLLRAFAALPEHAPDGRRLHLRLLAGGPQAAEYQALSAALGQQHRVEFVGGLQHAEMPPALQRLDIFVAPSRQESFGVSVLEASACERPVVASRVGGLPEVVEHGVTGLLVPPSDERALAAALLQLVTNPQQRRAMGLAGRRLVLQRYGWETCVSTMLMVYEQVLQSYTTRVLATTAPRP